MKGLFPQNSHKSFIYLANLEVGPLAYHLRYENGKHFNQIFFQATQAAISEAFKTPEVIRLFGRREPKQLRDRLETIDHDTKLNKLSEDGRDRQKAEILTALRQLGEQLSREELQFLEQHNSIANAFKNVEFIEVTDE